MGAHSPVECCIPAEEKNNITFYYKNINSFIRNGGLLWLTPHGDRHIQSLTSCFFDESFDTNPVLSQEGAPAPSSRLSCLLVGCLPNDWPPDSLRSENFCTIHFLDAHTFFLLAQFTWFISAVPCLHRCNILFRNPHVVKGQYITSNRNNFQTDLFAPHVGP